MQRFRALFIGLFLGLESYFLSVIPGSFLGTAQGAKILVPVTSTLITYLFTDFLLKQNWSRRKKITVAIAVFVLTVIVSIAVSASIIYSQQHQGE